jgi:two-component system response regulator AtoC
MSDEMDERLFNLYGMDINLKCIPAFNKASGFGNNLSRFIHNSPKKKNNGEKKLFVGQTQGIRRINAMLPNLQQTADTILITGDPGTGKELLSRMIAGSNEENTLFIKIDCALFGSEKDMASCTVGSRENGHIIESLHQIPFENRTVTILLSRIDQLELEAQNDILYLLENRLAACGYDSTPAVRYISTSEKDLYRLVEKGHFRNDLLYRLNAIPILCHPLKNRLEDVQLLIDYFSIAVCTEMNKGYVFPKSETIEQMCQYNWPGNIDELKQIITKYVLTGEERVLNRGVKNPKMKPAPTQLLYETMKAVTEPNVAEIRNCLKVLGDMPLKNICQKFAFRTEKKLLQKALETTNWNRKKAAALLNISYKSMLNKMKMYEIV